MNGHAVAVLAAGLGLGLGLWVVFIRLPALRQPTFAERVEPQLRSAASRSGLLAQEEPGALFGPLERILRLIVSDAVTRLDRFNISVKGLEGRLDRAGRSESPLEFRAVQLLWTGAGMIAGVAAALLLLWRGQVNVLGGLTLIVALMLGGYLGCDYQLGARIKRRQTLMLAEFPALAELMALAVGAGESAGSALDRVARQSRGELSGEFAKVVAQTRAGTPLVQGLAEFSERMGIPALSRFVDGISVAVNRGTPLADVLRAQAQDVRDVAKRELMEAAGRKEIAMMVPLVFGVLPLTVIFAVFPGLALLQFGF